ncbi:MAG: hypothetical protein JW843_07255 [Candidatus Aminicenantes bacterium]|nr:hypothetical protein [Candidatus Aminicenantes bacterium]
MKKSHSLRQKARFEKTLEDRLAFLAGKGKTPAQTGRDPLVRKWRAEVKAVGNRLKRLAELEKQNEDMAKIKAERAAAPREAAPPVKDKQPGKDRKAEKGQDAGKEKKAKPEKKKAPEGAQG